MSLRKCITVVFAEFAIMVLGIVALEYGIDGAIFVTVVATIAGLGGYSLKKTGDTTDGKSS